MAFRRVHAPLRACAFAWCALSWSSRALASPELGANKDYEPLGADEYVEEQGRRDVDAFGATTLAPAVSSDAAAASPAPYASPSLADTDLASRSLVETYPPEVMLSVDDPAYSSGDGLLGRATYFDAPAAWKTTFSSQIFGDLHGNGCGYVDKGPGEESNADFPFFPRRRRRGGRLRPSVPRSCLRKLLRGSMRHRSNHLGLRPDEGSVSARTSRFFRG